MRRRVAGFNDGCSDSSEAAKGCGSEIVQVFIGPGIGPVDFVVPREFRQSLGQRG